MAGVKVLASLVIVLVLVPALAVATEPRRGDASVPPIAAAAPSLEGAWQGTLVVRAMRLRLVVKIKRRGADWTGTAISVDQNAAETPIDVVNVEGDRVTLALANIGASY